MALLEETVDALRALFDGRGLAGRRARAGAHRAARCPPARPQLWVGGLSDAVLGGRGARSPTRGTAGATTSRGSRPSAARLRELADGRDVAPTWGGIALVGEDDADLDRLLAERAAKGLSPDGVWTGTGAELRAFADGLGGGGRDLVHRAARRDRRTGST